MTKRRFKLVLSAFALVAACASQAADLDELLQRYARESERPFDERKGAVNWSREMAPGSAGQPRSCVSCHGETLASEGRHVRTRKRIAPLSPSVNPERLTDAAKIEKWFLRNCKWTWGRECTAQEKGDFLLFISNK
jgi:hypothetical protein